MTEFISFQHIQKKYSGVYNTTMLPFTSLFSPHDKHSITYARSPFLFFVHPVKIITAISSPSTGTNEISSTDLILWLIFLWALGKIQTPTGTFHSFCAWALSRGGFSCAHVRATACPSVGTCAGGLSLSPEISFDNTYGKSVFNLSTPELNFSKTNSSEWLMRVVSRLTEQIVLTA